MLSGWEQNRCILHQADCLMTAKQNLDSMLFIIYEDFERGMEFVGAKLGLPLSVAQRRPMTPIDRVTKQIDPLRFKESFAAEIELYEYARRRFEDLVS